MLVTLATDLADPIERLAVIRESTQSSKVFNARVSARNLMDVLEVVPDPLVGPAFRAVGLLSRLHLTSGAFNTVVSGLPGPDRPMYLRGAQMTHLFGAAPLVDGIGLMNMHGSYNGQFTLFYTACLAMMPDSDRYTACIRRSFDDLRSAV